MAARQRAAPALDVRTVIHSPDDRAVGGSESQSEPGGVVRSEKADADVVIIRSSPIGQPPMGLTVSVGRDQSLPDSDWVEFPSWYLNVVAHGCPRDAARVVVMRALHQRPEQIAAGFGMTLRTVRRRIEQGTSSLGLIADETWEFVSWLIAMQGVELLDAMNRVVDLLEGGWRECPVSSALIRRSADLQDDM